MHIIIGYCKGEAFIVGHTTSRAKADKWIEQYPNGTQDEFDYVERQTSRNL